MRPQRQFSEEQKQEVLEALKQETDVSEYKRIQAVWLRMSMNLSAAKIAEILGMHKASIWKIHARFFKEGATIFKNAPKGGRRRENLTLAEERKLLEPFEKDAEKSGVLITSAIRRAYEKKVGRKVAPSTIYRMLERHKWRKITPRPSHPKASEENREAFKKL